MPLRGQLECILVFSESPAPSTGHPLPARKGMVLLGHPSGQLYTCCLQLFAKSPNCCPQQVWKKEHIMKGIWVGVSKWDQSSLMRVWGNGQRESKIFVMFPLVWIQLNPYYLLSLPLTAFGKAHHKATKLQTQTGPHSMSLLLQ